jgi:hypothetical protein
MLHSTVSHFYPPRCNRQWRKRKWKTPLFVKCDFRTLRIFVQQKFTGKLLKHMVKVQRMKVLWRNGVGCSKKAEQMCKTRNEVGDCVGSLMIWKKKVKAAIRQNRRFTVYKLREDFCGRPESETWPETKDVVQDWLKGLPATFRNEDIQKLVPRYDTWLNLHSDYTK